MNDDRLVGMLGALRTERMDRQADQTLRARLETAWTLREAQPGLSWRIRRPVLVIATAALIFGSVNSTLSAGGDNPLYSLRVTIENAAIRLHIDPDDRAAYLLSLLEQRTAEAARLEATGNALAAGAVRDVERATLALIQANLPPDPETVQPAPTASRSPSPTPEPTPEPTPVPTPQPTPLPTVTRTTAPRPTATVKITPTVKPTVKPTATPITQTVTLTGTIKNPDGTPATNVCVSLSLGSSCLQVTTSSTFKVTFSYKVGRSVTLYFLRTDGVKTYKATLTKTVSSTFVEVGTVTLKVQ